MSDGYSVVIEPAAWDAIMRLPRRDQERVLTAIEGLEISPRPSGVKKLEGAHNLYRVRSGDYRIIYSIEDGQLVVIIIKVGNRRDVYKGR